jgi:diguanylate cyclase (GGDEF)-like protein/PAS domain S-box-containing protein
MLLSKIRDAKRLDSQLPPEVRVALVHSLYGPFRSLIVGAVSGGVIGLMVSYRSDDIILSMCSLATFVVGLIRIAVGAWYKTKTADEIARDIRFWEKLYVLGAWAYSGSLGLLCFFAFMLSTDAPLHLVVSVTTAGYAAGITGRNAGRPIIALGQLVFASLPLAMGLLFYGDTFHFVMGIIIFLFTYGMTDITLSIRDIIVQALVSTREKSALAARYGEQAQRFDAALNNMSHGLCMFDAKNRLLVWNERFLELSGLAADKLRPGIHARDLVRASIRAGNHPDMSVRQLMLDLGRQAAGNPEGQMITSVGRGRSVAVSRRRMADGGAVMIFEDVTERVAAHQRIEHLARFDELTGLMNRTSLRDEIQGALNQVRRGQGRLAIHLVDLDWFKTVNDTLGHPTGDKLLKSVADRLTTVVSEKDSVARFGGDEFVVLQRGLAPDEDPAWLAASMIEALALPFDIDGNRLHIGASIGIAVAPVDGNEADKLIKNADLALYAAKAQGRGLYRFFEAEMSTAVEARRTLEVDLRKALAEGQFEVFYQPILSIQTQTTTVFEALVRWRHPERGMISPATFIPLAEETGLIVPLGRWVLRRACADAAAWGPSVKVAVNLSPVQFRDADLTLAVVDSLGQSGLSPGRLELEITETVLMQDIPSTSRTIEALHDLGVRLSLDDFGTGYSSLSYLRRFPFDKIKIDGSFVKEIENDVGSKAIVHAVADLGRELGMSIVAEGVETQSQFEMVRDAGCTDVQGYLFGRPMNFAASLEHLDSERTTRRVA